MFVEQALLPIKAFTQCHPLWLSESLLWKVSKQLEKTGPTSHPKEDPPSSLGRCIGGEHSFMGHMKKALQSHQSWLHHQRVLPVLTVAGSQTVRGPSELPQPEKHSSKMLPCCSDHQILFTSLSTAHTTKHCSHYRTALTTKYCSHYRTALTTKYCSHHCTGSGSVYITAPRWFWCICSFEKCFL